MVDRDTAPDRTVAEAGARLADLLGLAEPIPPEVVRRALAEPEFESDLMVSRGAPGFLRALFDHPDTRAYAQVPAPVRAGAPAGNLHLLGSATAALARWAKGGFSTVDAEVLSRREAACLSCPHLVDPRRAVQKLVPARPASDRVGARTGGKVCDLCGCVVARKIRMTTESCPAAHPTSPGLTRWAEPQPAPDG